MFTCSSLRRYLTLSPPNRSLVIGCRLLEPFLQFWYFLKIVEWKLHRTLIWIICSRSTVFLGAPTEVSCWLGLNLTRKRLNDERWCCYIQMVMNYITIGICQWSEIQIHVLLFYTTVLASLWFYIFCIILFIHYCISYGCLCIQYLTKVLIAE